MNWADDPHVFEGPENNLQFGPLSQIVTETKKNGILVTIHTLKELAF